MNKFSEIYGLVTVGERGQVVIPNKARAEYKIKAGDRLLVMSGPPGQKKFFTFIPMSQMEDMMQKLESHVSQLSQFSKKRKKSATLRQVRRAHRRQAQGKKR
ncbi:MAG: hypothetical protein ACD_62C00658G0011 [uncultured bacterium]|nr:MAG: hypothetical protein ACD_62C00658G0011 [uncultured bacterium]